MAHMPNDSVVKTKDVHDENSRHIHNNVYMRRQLWLIGLGLWVGASALWV